jgi:S-adenosylmethionine synthetase
VDKVLLSAGSAEPGFRGGRIINPIQIYLAGRAAQGVEGERLPIQEIASNACRGWLRRHLHALDPDKHAHIHVLFRPGSRDLTDLFMRQQRSGTVLANDTSCGVAYAPLSNLERAVLAVDRALLSSGVKMSHPEIGEDIKIMGVRQGDATRLTLSAALIGLHLADPADYCAKKEWIAEAARIAAEAETKSRVEAQVNAADEVPHSLYLTVTGTSAEMGDDGEAGRGDRANGLITPYRPMTLESIAGKNPVSHVGKLYNIAAGLIAQHLVDGIDEVLAANCVLVSRIGEPISRPQIVDIRLLPREGIPVSTLAPRVEEIVHARLERMGELSRDLIEGRITFDTWPLDRSRPAMLTSG